MVVHIIGAGLAGLSTAVHLTQLGVKAVVYEATDHAGGRCWSFFDTKTQAFLDCGTHLMTGANKALFELLEICDSENTLTDEGSKIPFYDVKRKKFFQVNLAHPLRSIFRAKKIYPLIAKSIMNTPVDDLDHAMVVRTLFKCLKKDSTHVFLAKKTLKESVIDPIEKYLKKNGVSIHFNHRLKAVYEEELVFFDKTVSLEKEDMVVLTLPLPSLSKYVRNIDEFETNTILNIHYKSDAVLKNGRSFTGIIGSPYVDFVFTKNGVVSVTLSAADKILASCSTQTLVKSVWKTVSQTLRKPGVLPSYRIIANKRATPVQTKRFNDSRPQTDIGDYMLFWASDCAQTGLPCTMESAVLSGKNAAETILQNL